MRLTNKLSQTTALANLFLVIHQNVKHFCLNFQNLAAIYSNEDPFSSSFACSAPTNKDGTLDMRYAVNKKAKANNNFSGFELKCSSCKINFFICFYKN